MVLTVTKTIERKAASKRLSKPARKALFEAYEVSYAMTEALLAAMASKGVTRAAVARELGVSPSYIEPVFGATPRLNIRKLSEVCEVLGVDVWSLLATAGQRRRSVAIPWTQAELDALATAPKKHGQ